MPADAPTTPAPLVLDSLHASKVLGIGQRTLTSLVACHKIPVIRIGRRLLFSVDDLRAFVASCRVPAREAENGQGGRAAGRGGSGVFAGHRAREVAEEGNHP